VRRLSEIAHEIDQRLRETWHGIYAGIALGDQATSIEIRLTVVVSEELRHLVEALAQGFTVRFIHVLNSLEALEAVRDRVSTEWRDLEEARIAIVVLGLDLRLNRVLIQVENLSTHQADLLAARFGPNQVFVQPGRRPAT
jgi:hypothetical protein